MAKKNICGAKTRSGKPCQNKPMKNGRCYKHGGKSTGAKGNKNALKHGAYSKFFSEEEKQHLEKIELTNIESELQLCKIQLVRALKAQEKQTSQGEQEKLEIIAQTVQAVKDGESLSRQQINKSFAKTDFGGVIDRLLGRIQSLTHSLQDMQIKQIDLEMRRIELDKVKSSKADNEALPVKIVIDVKDARLNDKAEPEHASS